MSPSLSEEALTSEANRNETKTLPVRDSKKRTRDTLFRFRGVRRRSWGRYVSEIRIPGKKTRIWLGSFVSAEMAARAYDSAAFFLRGKSVTLNFPDSVDSLPRPRSSSPRDIQMAAAKAALELEAKSGRFNSENSGSNRLSTDQSSYSGSGSGLDSEEAWWGLDSELVSLFEEEEEKETSLLNPLRLGSRSGDLLLSEVMRDGFLF